MTKRGWQLLVGALAVAAFAIGFTTMSAASPDTKTAANDPSTKPPVVTTKPPTPTPPATSNAPTVGQAQDAAPCTASSFGKVPPFELPESGGENRVTARLTMTNHGKSDCSITDYPNLSFSDSKKAHLSINAMPEVPEIPARKVRVPKDRTVTIELFWRPPSPDEQCADPDTVDIPMPDKGQALSLRWPDDRRASICDKKLTMTTFDAN